MKGKNIQEFAVCSAMSDCAQMIAFKPCVQISLLKVATLYSLFLLLCGLPHGVIGIFE
jgi:hypothetical protein